MATNWLEQFTPRGRMAMAEAAQNRRRDEYLQAAVESGQIMPQGQMGPPAAYGAPGGISPEFAARVAAIPGYQQLGAQLFAQAQQRNMAADEREWSAANMPLFQRESLAQQRHQWENISPYQQRMLGINQQQADQQGRYQQGQLGLQQAEVWARMQEHQARLDAMRQPGAAYPQPGSKEYAADLDALNAADGGIKNVARLRQLWDTSNLGWDREKMGAADALRTTLMGQLAKMQGAGTLQEGDVARYNELLAEPGVLNLLRGKGAKRRNAMLDELKSLFERSLSDVRERNPNLPGGEARGDTLPPGFRVVK